MNTIAIAVGLMTVAFPAADVAPESFFVALRSADARLATIADRLTTANVALCDQRVPTFGLLLHGFGQYQPADWPTVRRVFGFRTPVSVEAVIDGGAAQAAGVAADDGVIAIGGKALPPQTSSAKPTSRDRDQALSLLDTAPLGQVLTMTVDHGGQVVEHRLTPHVACRSRFEMVVGSGFDAQADGLNVQLGERYFEGFSDEEIAVVVAHELAHNILHHRARLDAAGISREIAGEFGRNARLIRLTEDQADALSVYLIANAGYDPYAPGRFWRAYGNRLGIEGIFRSRTHSSAEARAKAMDAIAASIKTDSARPLVPPLLGERDKPLN